MRAPHLNDSVENSPVVVPGLRQGRYVVARPWSVSMIQLDDEGWTHQSADQAES